MSPEQTLPVIHPRADAVDVGSVTHYVAIGPQPEDVRIFGCYTEDLHALSQWLTEHGIIAVAMESTSSYWKGLFQRLWQDGLEVLLVNGKHTCNVKGRKTDVLDCQWIQRLPPTQRRLHAGALYRLHLCWMGEDFILPVLIN